MPEKEFVRQENAPDVIHDEKANDDDVHKLDLRGTLFMTMTLGVLMIISWLGVFMLFMERM